MLHLYLFSLVGFLASPVTSKEWIVGQTVNTSSGSLIGHSSPWKPLVSEYLGVPFAQPPIGSLRFAAPRSFRGTRRIVADKYGPSCPVNIQIPDNAVVSFASVAQTILGRVGQFEDTFSEDCLSLNVWTRPQSGESKKAVLVWIYGGGFNSGSTTNPGYNGAHLADERDVVVVSISYRTNIFGFPRADFLPDQNLGLLDQRLAVEWVRDNIAAFGGDPARITLFGQSAGGASVDYYTMAWTKDPIANAFIAESGFATDVAPSNASIWSGWYSASEKLGCGGVSASRSTLECMRRKPWKDVLGAIEVRGVTPNLGAGGFGPTVDGKVVFEDVTRRRKQGLFIQRPLLVGNAANEAAFYQLIAASRGLPTNSTGTANLIACGPRAVARSRVDNRVPAWRYVYAGEYPNQDIGFPGAWHGSEIGMVFGTSELTSRRASTAQQSHLGQIMTTAWTDFAKEPWYGLKLLGWPTYIDDKPTVIRLGGRNSSEIAFESSDLFTKGCPPSSYT